jgi:acetamidase/formamidase
MALEIAINRIVPGPYGWTWAGDWSKDSTDPFGLEGKETMLSWTLDREAMTGRDRAGHTVALHPFMGVMGMPPNEPGVHITAPPRPCGGNIDCKELVEGSTLYLPISVPGALFSVGDGHAAQGDGEVSRTAIECPMDVVDLTFNLRDDMYISTPRAHTPVGWITLAFHEDLNVATRAAISAMLDLLVEQFKVERADAFALASVVVDMHITQIVNGVSGVHAILPHGAIR